MTTALNYGLEYPSGLLDSLQVVPSSPLSLSAGTTGSHKHASSANTGPPPPIRLLPPSLFTSLHLQHLLSHPPDHVLFPFLHGLEGDNDAQNTFFANAGAGSHCVVGVEVPVHVPLPVQVQMKHGHFHTQPPSISNSAFKSNGGKTDMPGQQTQMQVQHHQLLRPKVPRYRGLVWVVCEEDVKDGGDRITLSVLRRKELVVPQNAGNSNPQGTEGEDSEDSDCSESSFDDDDEDDDDEDLEDLDFGDDERDAVPLNVAINVGHGDTINNTPILGIPTKTKDELSKVEMDSMPYMHPVISPHLNHNHNPHHHPPPQLSSINTSFAHVSAISSTPTSISSFSTSGSDSLTETETVATSLDCDASTAPTSISGSPLSASPSAGYPQVIALEEVEGPIDPPSKPVGTAALAHEKSAKSRWKPVASAIVPTPNGVDTKDVRNSGKKTKKVKGKGRSKPVNPSAPPLLTCTFRPKELLRKRRGVIVSGATDKDDAANDGENMAGPLREGQDEELWEFVPARVPEGISLRNFGIQMPIYATLSDIVVYSPKGPTPATMALANRFREAVWRKRKERVEALKGIVYTRVHGHQNQQHQQQGAGASHFIKIEDVLKAERDGRAIQKTKDKALELKSNREINAAAVEDAPNAATNTPPNMLTPSPSSPSPSLSDSDPSSLSDEEEEEEDLETRMLDTAERYILSLVEDDLLSYNVFVLDADEGEMRGKGGMAHLMMRSCGAGVPGGVDHGRMGIILKGESANSGKSGAHTIGRDGELKGEKAMEERLAGSDKKKGDAGDGNEVTMDIDADAEMVVGDMDIDSMGGDADIDMLEEQRADNRHAVDEEDDGDEDHMNDKPISSGSIPNTVNFALREKEEMRDLTKASEIISLFPVYGSTNRPPMSPTFNSMSVSEKAWTPTPPTSPPHLQHLGGLVPPTRSPTIPASLSSHVLPASHLRQHAVDYTFTHSDPTVDISSPATFFEPLVGQVFLGNSGDVPLATNAKVNGEGGFVGSAELEDEDAEPLPLDDPFNFKATNNPAGGFGYDICIECHELAPFPTPAHVRAADEHLGVLEVMWRGRCVEREKERRTKSRNIGRKQGQGGAEDADEDDFQPIIIPARPPPHANAVIHLPFPSSPPNSQQTMAQLIPVMRFLEKWIRPVPGEVTIEVEVRTKMEDGQSKDTTLTPASQEQQQGQSGVRRWSSSVASLIPSVFGSGSSSTNPPSPSTSARSRSYTAPIPSSHRRNSSSTSSSSSSSGSTPAHPTRPLKLLLYSADGYTESSLAALCLLMSIKTLTLPEAYLDLQVSKRRSFFVYAHDLGVMRRVESRLLEERERERERVQRERERQEMERMVKEAREREARERTAREQVMMNLEEPNALNANGKRTIGSVHAAQPNAGATAPATEKGTSSSGGLSLFKVFGGSASSAATSAASPSAAGPGMPSPSTTPSTGSKSQHAFTGRPAAKSVSFSQAPIWGQRGQQVSSNALASSTFQIQQVRVPPTIPQGVDPSEGHVALRPPEEYTGSLPGSANGTTLQRKSATLPSISGASTASSSTSGQMGHGHTGTKRPRANTSPWLPSFFGGDHQSWFNDPRFDGSFPSRVLPFLYLGNLNHASNVYMLHALGITHVVSVGECALLPPPYHMVGHSSGTNNAPLSCAPRSNGGSAHTRSGHGSLWIEEREGRIKVLDIKGVCDDGIDTLEPQLEPICEWIDKAREEGGQVLVHCRVGVSRSATVTIAYVMKHLSLPLVDAYLIVRSRRLSVLIQPNMRLLYNLCGWEIKLAKERAGWVEDEESKNAGVGVREKVMEKRLERELARTLTWPYLSMEVHKLNEKYLH